MLHANSCQVFYPHVICGLCKRGFFVNLKNPWFLFFMCKDLSYECLLINKNLN